MQRPQPMFFAFLITAQLITATVRTGGEPLPKPDWGRLVATAAALELGLPLPTETSPSPTPVPTAEPSPSPAPTATPTPTPEPTPQPTPEPSPTPTPEPTPAPTDRPGPEIVAFTDTAGVVIKNNTGFPVDIPTLMAEPLSQRLPAEGYQILIVHTHGTEAYEPTGADTYTPTDTYRTTDEQYNMIRVGDALAAALEGAGFAVLHDRALYDYPSYSGSYNRSAAAVEAALSQHPEIALVIDLHRDAVGNEEIMYKALSQLPEPTAQLMLVVGTGETDWSTPTGGKT